MVTIFRASAVTFSTKHSCQSLFFKWKNTGQINKGNVAFHVRWDKTGFWQCLIEAEWSFCWQPANCLSIYTGRQVCHTSLFTVLLFQVKQKHMNSLMRHPEGLVLSDTAESATPTSVQFLKQHWKRKALRDIISTVHEESFQTCYKADIYDQHQAWWGNNLLT